MTYKTATKEELKAIAQELYDPLTVEFEKRLYAMERRAIFPLGTKLAKNSLLLEDALTRLADAEKELAGLQKVLTAWKKQSRGDYRRVLRAVAHGEDTR